jgi:hypothetical protein
MRANFLALPCKRIMGNELECEGCNAEKKRQDLRLNISANKFIYTTLLNINS